MGIDLSATAINPRDAAYRPLLEDLQGNILKAHGNNLTLKGRYADGLDIDRKLIQLRPNDSLAHYNLACSYALLKKPDLALKTLRRAVELGYRDFRYMREDRDLETVRHDPRFRQLLREYESR